MNDSRRKTATDCDTNSSWTKESDCLTLWSRENIRCIAKFIINMEQIVVWFDCFFLIWDCLRYDFQENGRQCTSWGGLTFLGHNRVFDSGSVIIFLQYSYLSRLAYSKTRKLFIICCFLVGTSNGYDCKNSIANLTIFYKGNQFGYIVP